MSHEQVFVIPALLFREWPQLEMCKVFLYYQIATGYHAQRAVVTVLGAQTEWHDRWVENSVTNVFKSFFAQSHRFPVREHTAPNLHLNFRPSFALWICWNIRRHWESPTNAIGPMHSTIDHWSALWWAPIARHRGSLRMPTNGYNHQHQSNAREWILWVSPSHRRQTQCSPTLPLCRMTMIHTHYSRPSHRHFQMPTSMSRL